MKNVSTISKRHLLALTLASCVIAPNLSAAELNFSGFLSVGGGLVDDENGPAYGGYSEEDLKFDHNLLGLQVTGQVAEKLTATAQLIARSGDDYDVNAEWAYLTWQATDESKVRVGRLRTPFYMYSDFLDVGYSYAWITPPSEVYYLPFNNVDGIDYYTTARLGIFDTSLQAYFGTFDDDLMLGGAPSVAHTRNQTGVAATIGKDWWTFRAAYHEADLSIDVSGSILDPNSGFTLGQFLAALPPSFANNVDNVLIDDDKVSFAGVGLNIDTGTFVAAAEHVEFEAKKTMLSKNVREYVMVGWRAGDWLFHLTGSQSKDEIGHPEAGIPVIPQTQLIIGTLKAVAQAQVQERDVVTLGVRWDLTSGTALKWQVDDIDQKNVGDQQVYSVALQTVF